MTVAAPVPFNESQRLEALRTLMVLDTPAEPLFDSLARMAAQVCGVPIALISLVDAERQWFKANVGLTGINETPRDIAFCAHAIHSDEVMEVRDAKQDARFENNPLVTGSPDIRFYAGVPLLTRSDGCRVGTLCVIDRKAGELTPEQRVTLQALSTMVSQALDMRGDLVSRAFAARQAYEKSLADSELRYRTMVESQTEMVSLAWPDGKVFYANAAYANRFGLQPHNVLGSDLFSYVHPGDLKAVRERIAQALLSGESSQGNNRVVCADGTERWIDWTNSFLHDSEHRPYLHSVGRDITAQRAAERALQASEQLLERTGRVARVGGWEFDLRSGSISWSSETRRIHEVEPGYTPHLESALHFYAPESQQTMADVVRNAMETGQAWDVEVPLVTATGRRIWVRSVGEAEYDQGAVVRLFGAFQDVTERRRMAQQLANSERFVRQVTDGLPIRIGYIDRHLRFRFANEAVCLGFGQTRDAVLGRTHDEIVGASMAPQVNLRMQQALAGTAQRYESEEVIDGVAHRIDSQLVPDISDKGEVRGLFFTGTDITQRAAAEQRLRVLTAILEKTSDFVVQADLKGYVTYMNPAVRVALGLTPEYEVGGHLFTDFNTPETNALYSQTILEAVKKHGVWVGETTVYIAHQRVVPVSHMVIAHRDVQGRIQHYSAVMRDISDAAQARLALTKQTATLRSITEALPSLVAVVGADERYQFVNSAFERWHRVSRERIVGRTMQEFLGATEYAKTQPMIGKVLGGETLTFEKEFLQRVPASHVTIHFIPLWSQDGAVDGFVSMAQDVTSYRQEAGRLLELSQRDPLTSLLNRAGLEAYIAQKNFHHEGALWALLYIDLDHFKPVNDQHGHLVGDQLLQVFGQRLAALVRPADAVARLGGDEFAVVLAGVREPAHAEVVARKILEAAHTPFDLGALTLSVGASVGLALGIHATDTWQDLMARADEKLYLAKRSGRGQFKGPSDD